VNLNIQDLVKRHFWVVGVLTLAVCTFFAGRAVAHVIEAKALTDAVKAPEVAPAARASVAATTEARNKAGKPLSDRNIFCSECTPAPATVATTTTPGDGPPATQLPLNLIATFISDNFRLATVQNTDTQAQGGYLVNGMIPGAGPVVAIGYKYVDFKNAAQGNRVERLSLLAEPPPPAAAPPTTVADTGPAQPTDEMTALLDASIKKIDDSNYEIDRSLVDKLLANPMAATKGARVTASIKNGQPNGIKLYAIRPSSVYAKLGLSNGDTIHSINGNDLDSLDKGLEVYQKVKDESSLQVDITRRGKPMTIHYTIK
jgi:general secretion pathway protein C